MCSCRSELHEHSLHGMGCCVDGLLKERAHLSEITTVDSQNSITKLMILLMYKGFWLCMNEILHKYHVCGQLKSDQG